jgi:predicted metal-dependent hydrolase
VSSADPTELDWQRGALATGLTCYRKGEFFEAHEHWEAVWLAQGEPLKSFLQAVIQITAACHHVQRGNQAGAISLLTRSLRRLESSPAQFGGLDVQQLRADIAIALRQLDRGDPTTTITHPRIHSI